MQSSPVTPHRPGASTAEHMSSAVRTAFAPDGACSSFSRSSLRWRLAIAHSLGDSPRADQGRRSVAALASLASRHWVSASRKAALFLVTVDRRADHGAHRAPQVSAITACPHRSAFGKRFLDRHLGRLSRRSAHACSESSPFTASISPGSRFTGARSFPQRRRGERPSSWSDSRKNSLSADTCNSPSPPASDSGPRQFCSRRSSDSRTPTIPARAKPGFFPSCSSPAVLLVPAPHGKSVVGRGISRGMGLGTDVLLRRSRQRHRSLSQSVRLHLQRPAAGSPAARVGPEASMFTPIVLAIVAILFARVYRENRYQAALRPQTRTNASRLSHKTVSYVCIAPESACPDRVLHFSFTHPWRLPGVRSPMSETTMPTARTRVVREADRAVYDRETVYRILDEGFLCHVGFARRRPTVRDSDLLRPQGCESLHSRLGREPHACGR